MRDRKEKLLLLGVFFGLCLPLMAQRTMTYRVDGEKSYLIPELIALLIQENDSITVQMVMPPENRPVPYRDVDLKKGDRIFMANAARMRTIKDFIALYESLASGEVLKMGVQRGEDRFMVSFEKMKEMPEGMQLRVVRQPDQEGVAMTGTYLNSDSLAVLSAEGLVLTQSEERIVIKDILPDSRESLLNQDIQKRDVLAKLNGEAFQNLKEFREAYDRIAPGTEVRLTLIREEKEMVVTYKKPEPDKGPVLIRRTR